MRIRTADPLLAKQMLYQLSYAPDRLLPRLYCRGTHGKSGKIEKTKLCAAGAAIVMMVRVSTEGIAAIHNSSLELEVALGFRLRHAPLLLIPGLPGALGVDLSAFTSPKRSNLM